MNRQMEEAQAPEADVENLHDGIFVPEPACEVEVIAEERPLDEGFLMTPENLLSHTQEGSRAYQVGKPHEILPQQEPLLLK
ncbi:hypothetical protein Y1Q_0015704 [Alligator mississippiensis]|uniref:Uncharacterized protein n=1 Tax=Alligator mississippiensis TaxID=8496 RepID=A0A151NNW5_ALLMI|nr:hypothetical protein Y1Q_0015704 [Alligator mississippiensis]